MHLGWSQFLAQAGDGEAFPIPSAEEAVRTDPVLSPPARLGHSLNI